MGEAVHHREHGDEHGDGNGDAGDAHQRLALVGEEVAGGDEPAHGWGRQKEKGKRQKERRRSQKPPLKISASGGLFRSAACLGSTNWVRTAWPGWRVPMGLS